MEKMWISHSGGLELTREPKRLLGSRYRVAEVGAHRRSEALKC